MEGKTILYVEDDDNIRSIIARRLEEEKLKVVVATKGGEEALDVIRKGEYDLLLLDLGLPKSEGDNVDDPKEGFHILEQIKELPTVKNTPIVAYSNFGSREDIERSLKLGVKEHLVKSNFTPSELVEKVKKYL